MSIENSAPDHSAPDHSAPDHSSQARQATPAQPPSREARPIDPAVEDAVSTLFGLGRLWAVHGLNAGRAALRTSAVTLSTTADLLGEISDRVADERELDVAERPL